MFAEEVMAKDYQKRGKDLFFSQSLDLPLFLSNAALLLWGLLLLLSGGILEGKEEDVF